MIDRWKSLVSCTILLVLIVSGCVESKNSTVASKASNLPPGRDAAGEVMNPTADQLHELAGEFLAYIALHGKLPEKSEELQIGKDDKSRRLWLDPATGQRFNYTRNSYKLDQLRGRLVAYQNTADAQGRRWALLLNDNPSDGRVVMYVQLISETQLRASFVGN